MSDRKVVVITGASAGVGRATAYAFARRQWCVGLLARDPEALEAAGREIESVGGKALRMPVDVADAAAVRGAADQVISEWGCIDVSVNNAMTTVFAPVVETSPEEFARVTAVTYLGCVHGTLAALAHMRPRNAGTIVQIGSALAYRSIPLQSAYCAAKFAIRGFSDSLRSELIRERSGIRLTMVQLPAVNTPQFEWARSRMPRRAQPVPPIHQPHVIAEAILTAVERAPRELWVGTPTLQAILGGMVLPGVLDRLLARKAWEGQMTDEAERGHPDNLFWSVREIHRTQGRFGGRALSRVTSVSSSHVLAALAFAALIAALVLLAILCSLV